MSITVEWDNPEQTIIMCAYKGTWTWAEFTETTQKATDMQNMVDHTVYMILDMRDGTTPPNVAGKLREIARINQPNVGRRVLVTNSHVLKMFYQIFASVYRPAARQYEMVNSMEEAYAIIEELRAQHQETASQQ